MLNSKYNLFLRTFGQKETVIEFLEQKKEMHFSFIFLSNKRKLKEHRYDMERKVQLLNIYIERTTKQENK